MAWRCSRAGLLVSWQRAATRPIRSWVAHKKNYWIFVEPARPWRSTDRARVGAKSGLECDLMPSQQGAMPLYAVYSFGSKDFTVYGDFGPALGGLS